MNTSKRPPPQTGNRLDRSQKVFQRAYMACLACRKIKSKCAISDDLHTCVKCKREHRPCVFSARRSAKEGRNAHMPGSLELRGQSEGSIQAQQDEQSGMVAPMQLSDDPTRNDSSAPVRPGYTSQPPHQTDVPTGSLCAESDVGSSWSSEPAQADLQTELMQTVVASSQDAMNLLFKAAASEQDGDEPVPRSRSQPAPMGSNQDINLPPISGTFPSFYPQETLDYWNKSRFVRQGWLSAREGIAYVDLFFANLSHLSLVTNTYFAQHENHQTLIFQEPLLCSTLVMISSRHHPLAESRTASRSHIVHDLFWRHIEHLIHRLTFGHYVCPETKSRTLGCVEALLLLTEWQPRAVHAPQPSDGRDSHGGPGLEVIPGMQQSESLDPTKIKWREEVFEPASRANRMSWMMLGIASSLAHELGVYDDADGKSSARRDLAAKQRLRRLLYLNVNQLSLTMGCRSFLPSLISDIALNSITTIDSAYWEGEKVISLWIDLTSLLKMAKGMSTSSRSGMRDGSYNGLLEHFQPLLSQWYQRFQDFKPKKVSAAAVDLLFIDYQYVRIFVASVGNQDLVGHSSGGGGGGGGSNVTMGDILRLKNMSDFHSTKEVLDASLSILSKTVSLARADVLRYCPARVFFHITSACVFSLKTMGLGVLNADMPKSLGLLRECTEALTCSASDDNHPWGRYAVLIERYARHFRNKMEKATNTPPAPPMSNATAALNPTEGGLSSIGANGEGRNTDDLCNIFGSLDESMDDWLMQPWDLWMSSSNMQADPTLGSWDEHTSDFSHNLWAVQ